MNKRLKKKKLKYERARKEAIKRFGRALGPIFTTEIVNTMSRPGFCTGTPEEFMKWDNQQHPHWTRTSWGSFPMQGILKRIPVEVEE